MMLRDPPKAPTGMPPPMILPNVARSGRMPVSSATPPRATRKPEMTSSKISSAPFARVTARKLLEVLAALEQQAVIRGRGLDDHSAATARAFFSVDGEIVQRLVVRRGAARSAFDERLAGTPADEGLPKVGRAWLDTEDDRRGRDSSRRTSR